MIASHAVNIFGEEHQKLWVKEVQESLSVFMGVMQRVDKTNIDSSLLKDIIDRVTELTGNPPGQEINYKNIKLLSQKMTQLASKYDFQDEHFNNFLYQTSLCFFQLANAAYTNKTPIAEAFLNPHNRSTVFQNVVVDSGIKIGSKEVAKYFLRKYSDEVLPDFKKQCMTLDNITLTKPPQEIKNIKVKSALEKRLDDHANVLRSKVFIKDPESVSAYMSDQICLHAYEFYFNQIVMMYEALDHIDAFSENEEEKNKWLSESGLMALKNSESMNYLNKVAQTLAFKDAKELYHTYKDHQGKELASILLNKVDLFRKEVADSSVIQEKESPLIRLQHLSAAEYKRFNNKLSDKDFMSKNREYIEQICFASREFSNAISMLSRAKGIVNKANDSYANLDIIFGLEEERPFFIRAAHDMVGFMANLGVSKSLVDTGLFKLFAREEQMRARRQERMWQPIHQQWTKYVWDNCKANNQALTDLINNIKAQKYSYETLLDLMIQFEVDYTSANQKLQTLKVGDPEYSRQEKIKERAENIFKSKEAIFSLFKLSNVEEGSKEAQYSSSVEKMTDLHQQLMQKREVAAIELSDLQVSEGELLKALEKEKGGWFVSGAKKLFGYKNKREKELTQVLNQQLSKISVLKRNVKEIEIKQKRISLDIVSLEKEQEKDVLLKNKAVPDLRREFSRQVDQYKKLFKERAELIRKKATAEEFLENENHLLSCGHYLEKIMLHAEAGLNQPNHSESALEATLFLENIELLKMLLSMDVPNLAMNRTQILGRLEKLEDSVNSIIEHNQKQLQEDALAHLENEISINEKNIKMIFSHVVENKHYQRLDNEHKAEMHAFLDKKIEEYISKNKETMSLSALRDFFVQIKSFGLIHQVNENSEFVANQYTKALQSVQRAIDEKYKAIKLLPNSDVLEKLPLIQNDLMIGLEGLKNSVNDAGYYANQNELSSFDPRRLLMFWNGADMDKKKQAEVQAYQFICKKELGHYISIMEKHKDNILASYKETPLDECENEINKREIFAQQLSSLQTNSHIANHFDVSELIDKNNTMIESLREIKSTHPEKHLHTINAEIDTLSQGINKIEEGIKSFEMKRKLGDINVEDISNIGALLNESMILKKSLKDTLAIENFSSSSFLEGSSSRLDALSRKLDADYTLFNEKINPFSKVVKGESLDVTNIPDDTLGALLVLSLQHKNADAFEAIMNKKSNINVQSIVQAYIVAASLGDVDKANQLSSMRDDFTISSHDLNQALQQAVSGNHLMMAYHILLNNRLSLDHNTDKLLEKISAIQSTNMPKIKKTWGETLFGGGNLNNKNYRACFILAEQLITQAYDIYESSPKTEQDKIVLKEMVDYASNMADGLARKISLKTGDKKGVNYISTCKHYIQSIVSKMDVSLSSVSSGNIEQQIKQAEDNLIHAVNKWDIEDVMLKLSLLKNITFQDKNRFYKIISKALDEAKDENYLNILLSAVDESAKRKELAGNALLTSIREGKIDQLPIFIDHHGFDGNEKLIQELLIQLYDEKTEQRISQLSAAHINVDKMARLLMTTVPFNVDESLVKLIDYSTVQLPDTGKYTVTQGLMQRFSDKDKPVLDELKKIYILQEKQLQMLEDAFDAQVYSVYNNHLMEMNQLSELDQSAISKLNNLIKTYESRLEYQLNNMKETREQFFRHPLFNVQNQDRKLEHLNQWDNLFNQTINKITNRITKTTNEIKAELGQNNDNKRKSLLFGVTLGRGATESSSADFPPMAPDRNSQKKIPRRE